MGEANWFIGAVPWAIIVPRPGYRRSLKVFRLVPEVRREVNEGAFWWLAGVVFYTLTAPLWLPFVVLVVLGEWLGELRSFGFLPDFARKREQAIEKAWAKVPLGEIKRRIGEPVGTILPKKSEPID